MRWNIMLVDDDVEIQQMITVFLEQAGFVVRAFSDGFSAMEELRRNDYDLLLLDLAMPRFNGMQMLRKIRASEDLKNLPVIMLTGIADKDTFLRLRDEVNDYILKPPVRSNLLKRIERVLGGRPQFQEVSFIGDSDRNVGHCQLPVVLSSISQRGMVLLSPVPFQKNWPLEALDVTLLRELKIQQKKFNVSSCIAKGPGLFECYVSFLGMSTEDRATLKDWIIKRDFELKNSRAA